MMACTIEATSAQWDTYLGTAGTFFRLNGRWLKPEKSYRVFLGTGQRLCGEWGTTLPYKYAPESQKWGTHVSFARVK